MAAQLIATNGLSARGLSVWTARASSFLAGAALAQQQHGGVGRRHLLDGAADLDHRLADRDDALERHQPLALHQRAVLFLEAVDLEGALHEQAQHVGVHGLLVEIVGAHAHGLDGVLLVELAGDHDDLGAGGQPQDLEQGGEALRDALGVRRQAEVLQHHRRLVAAQGRQRARPVGRGNDLVIVEAPLELLLQPRVVLDDQQFRLVLSHSRLSLGDSSGSNGLFSKCG